MTPPAAAVAAAAANDALQVQLPRAVVDAVQRGRQLSLESPQHGDLVGCTWLSAWWYQQSKQGPTLRQCTSNIHKLLASHLPGTAHRHRTAVPPSQHNCMSRVHALKQQPRPEGEGCSKLQFEWLANLLPSAAGAVHSVTSYRCIRVQEQVARLPAPRSFLWR